MRRFLVFDIEGGGSMINYLVLSKGAKKLGITLPETNSSHLKMVVSNRNLLCQGSIFGGYVSFRECI